MLTRRPPPSLPTSRFYEPHADAFVDPTGSGVHDCLKRLLRIPAPREDWDQWMGNNSLKRVPIANESRHATRSPLGLAAAHHPTRASRQSATCTSERQNATLRVHTAVALSLCRLLRLWKMKALGFVPVDVDTQDFVVRGCKHIPSTQNVHRHKSYLIYLRMNRPFERLSSTKHGRSISPAGDRPPVFCG